MTSNTSSNNTGPKYGANLSNHAAKQYNEQASFVYSSKFTSAVLNLLDAKPGERIIDFGCGTGELTEIIKQAVGAEGEVYGVDSSQDMLDKAGKSTAGIKYFQGDIQKIPETFDPSLKGSFDAIFTSAVLHWCKEDPEGVVRGIDWLLKPGGRVAFEFGGYQNVADVRIALHAVLKARGYDAEPRDPWYFPTDKQYDTILKNHGLQTSEIALHPRPTPCNSDILGWANTFVRNTFLQGIAKPEADEILEEVQDRCRSGCYWNVAHPGMGRKEDEDAAIASGQRRWGETEGWSLMYVRLRGLAIKNKEI